LENILSNVGSKYQIIFVDLSPAAAQALLDAGIDVTPA